MIEREAAKHVYRCAVAAHLAYLDGPALETELAAAGFTMVAALQRGSHHALVVDDRSVSDGSVRLLAFRGTDDAADWRTNLNVWFRATPWGRVHRGFQDAVSTFWPEVDGYLRDAIAARRKTWVTGHSLGGALALLAAARLAAEAQTVDRICTFGQPPVGGSRFCDRCLESFGDRYIRCVNHTDAVVEDLSFWRQHTGTLWYFDVDGHLHHQVDFRRNLLDHVLAPHRLGGLSQFGAHAMSRYMPLLETLAGSAASSFSPRG
jgi:triacylglycerol lipase